MFDLCIYFAFTLFGTDGTFCGQEEVVKKEKLYKQYFSTVKYSLEGTKGH